MGLGKSWLSAPVFIGGTTGLLTAVAADLHPVLRHLSADRPRQAVRLAHAAGVLPDHLRADGALLRVHHRLLAADHEPAPEAGITRSSTGSASPRSPTTASSSSSRRAIRNSPRPRRASFSKASAASTSRSSTTRPCCATFSSPSSWSPSASSASPVFAARKCRTRRSRSSRTWITSRSTSRSTRARSSADGRAARKPVAGTIPMGYKLPGSYLQAGAQNATISRSRLLQQPDYCNTGKIGDVYGDGFPIEVNEDAHDARPGALRHQLRASATARPAGAMASSRPSAWSPSPTCRTTASAPCPTARFSPPSPTARTPWAPTARKIAVEDRWAIVAYIRALQKSQNVQARRAAPRPSRRNSTPSSERPSRPRPRPAGAGDASIRSTPAACRRSCSAPASIGIVGSPHRPRRPGLARAVRLLLALWLHLLFHHLRRRPLLDLPPSRHRCRVVGGGPAPDGEPGESASRLSCSSSCRCSFSAGRMLWKWWDVPAGVDPLLDAKAGFLNHGFFYHPVLPLFSPARLDRLAALLERSIAQDSDGEARHTLRDAQVRHRRLFRRSRSASPSPPSIG